MRKLRNGLIWLSIGVLFGGLISAQSASAGECKMRATKVKIVGTFADFPPPAIQADNVWSAKVEARYGKPYSALLAARDVRKYCRNLRNNKQECTVIARPCKVVLN